MGTAPELPARCLEGLIPVSKPTDNTGQASMEESNGGKNKPTSLSFVASHCGQVWQQLIMNSAF